MGNFKTLHYESSTVYYIHTFRSTGMFHVERVTETVGNRPGVSATIYNRPGVSATIGDRPDASYIIAESVNAPGCVMRKFNRTGSG